MMLPSVGFALALKSASTPGDGLLVRRYDPAGILRNAAADSLNIC